MRTIKPIPGFPGYFAGSDGTIWTSRPSNGRGPLLQTMRPKIATRRKHGPTGFRLEVCLMRNNRRFYRNPGRLVLEAFVGPRPRGMQVCHRDDDQSNNRRENLRWDTPKANCADRDRNGKTHSGERHHFARLTASDVRKIRNHLQRGTNRQVIADSFSVHIGTIDRIAKRKTWKHLP